MPQLSTSSQPQPTIVFLHIPKTAGTTLYTIMDRQFQLKETVSIYGKSEHLEKTQKIQKFSPDLKRKITLIKGHTYLGWHKILPQTCIYFTFLRNPIDRFISYYSFAKKLANHPLHQMIKENDMSLADFALLQGEDNCQTRFLATMINEGELEYKSEPCSVKILEKAKINMQKYCSIVGITEEFDKSLLLLTRKFGWNNVFYIVKNKNKSRLSIREISKETLKLLEKKHEFDLELYEYSKQLFAKMIEEQGDDFEKDLYDFQKTNSSMFGKFSVITETSMVKFQKFFPNNGKINY